MAVPNYAQANKAAKTLNLKIKHFCENSSEVLELASDITDVNVYTTSGYHQRRHGKESLCRKKDPWKKIHLVLDVGKQQIIAMAFTESNVNDCEVVNEAAKQIKTKVKSVRADGGYDNDWKSKALIPPATTSKAQDELKKRNLKKKHLEQRII